MGSKSRSMLIPSLAQRSPLSFSGTSFAESGKSRMCPRLDSTTKSLGRNLAMVLALVGDSTMTRDLPNVSPRRYVAYKELAKLKASPAHFKGSSTAMPPFDVARKSPRPLRGKRPLAFGSASKPRHGQVLRSLRGKSKPGHFRGRRSGAGTSLPGTFERKLETQVSGFSRASAGPRPERSTRVVLIFD